ncbi:hypothetical protein FVE85_8920 [Porphyridium purpureum]|uniref:Uncharacterized protein n=1 Tax=Porphyridium purpureum TaxID=35688 RepID=A0A5J4YFW4_PORPP|nr:hypothetical protein FVE85_8920 [Porphyridium purpureum]|eukprot:POR9199..scf276_29
MQDAFSSPSCSILFSTLGRKPKEFGLHSLRKGAAMYATCGSVGGSSLISILRRGGWSVGDTLGRYLRADSAGDQFVGRCLAGLPINKATFALLPPHFTTESLCNQLISTKINTAIHMVFPFVDLAEYMNMREILLMRLASLIFHREWLQSTLPANHPLRQKFVTTAPELAELADYVVTTSESGMTATGIPPQTAILKQLQELRPENLLDGVKRILEECARRHDRPVKAESLLHFWKGKYRLVPKKWPGLPTVSPAADWQLWWEGYEHKFSETESVRISAFRLLKASDFATRSGQYALTEWRNLMTYYTNKVRILEPAIDHRHPSLADIQNMWKALEKHGIAPKSAEKMTQRTIRASNRTVLTTAKVIRKRRRAENVSTLP